MPDDFHAPEKDRRQEQEVKKALGEQVNPLPFN